MKAKPVKKPPAAPRDTSKEVQELHATLPEQFKSFVRNIAAVPKDAVDAAERAAGHKKTAKKNF